MPWLIQGVFFQKSQWLGVDIRPIDGAVAVVKSGLVDYSFAGAIWQTSTLFGTLTGQLTDHFGVSTLKNINMVGNTLCFTKTYDKHPESPVLLYRFERDGNTWIGTYSSKTAGTGVARCIMTQVDESFFDPHTIVTLLGLTAAHEWPSEVQAALDRERDA